MRSLTQTYKIKSSSTKVWDALVNPKTISKWGAGPAKMSEKEGSPFSLWGGNIHGKNLKVVKFKELTQEWMSGTWEKFSKVNFKLEEKEEITTVTLKHSGIPDEEYQDISEGWKLYYLGEIKNLLET